MNTFGRIIQLLLFVVVSALMMGGQVQATEACHQINAKGVGQDLGGGVTVAEIIGGGLLQGTTTGNFVITGGSAPLFSLAGTVEFTTNRGTLTVTITGLFDVSSGQFSASGIVTDATGKLAGATGDLAFAGVEDLSDGSFVEDVTGGICVDLAPEDHPKG